LTEQELEDKIKTLLTDWLGDTAMVTTLTELIMTEVQVLVDEVGCNAYDRGVSDGYLTGHGDGYRDGRDR